MIYSGDDHIYKFSKDSVCVQYRMEFKDPKAKYTSGRPKKFSRITGGEMPYWG